MSYAEMLMRIYTCTKFYRYKLSYSKGLDEHETRSIETVALETIGSHIDNAMWALSSKDNKTELSEKIVIKKLHQTLSKRILHHTFDFDSAEKAIDNIFMEYLFRPVVSENQLNQLTMLVDAIKAISENKETCTPENIQTAVGNLEMWANEIFA